MHRLIVAGPLMVALLAAGPTKAQRPIENPPSELLCAVEWRRYSSELRKSVIRLRCSDEKFTAGLAQVYDGAAAWEGILACPVFDCGRDKITIYSESPIEDGQALTCREVGRLLPREWACQHKPR